MLLHVALRKTGIALLVVCGCLSGPAMAGAPGAAAVDTSPASLPVPALPPGLQNLDAYVKHVREAFDVPGIGVAIVKDGHVVLEQGYGLRDVESGKPVDAHTVFTIASNTKAFTAAALSILDDEGKLDMGGRVVDYLPWFRMSDPYVTHEMRVRDLLAHHSGLSLGAGDLLSWPGTDYTTREIVGRLAHVPLKHGFRARYFYDNILYTVAGLVIRNVSGQSYHQFVRSRILDPLGLKDTRFNYHFSEPGEHDLAIGYAKYDFKDLKPVSDLSRRAPSHSDSGAGGLHSSVHDMARWIITQLNGGVYGTQADGSPKRLFSAARHREMWSVQSAIHPRKSTIPELAAVQPDYEGYGEGWHLSQYRRHKMVFHTGGVPGFVSRVTMIPDMKLGLVVLTNAESGAAFRAVTNHILDAYLGAPQTDWVSVYEKADAGSKAAADESWRRHLAARDKNAGPSLPLKDYAGTYRDPWYGDVGITDHDGKLVMRFSHTRKLVGDMTHWSRDTFLVRWHDRSLNADAFVTFALTPDGGIREVRMQPVSPLTDFSYDFQDLRLTPQVPL